MTVRVVAPPPAQSPRGGYTIAITVMGVCAIIITAIIGRTWSATGSHSSVLYVCAIGAIIGIVVGATTHVRWENAKGDRRIERNQQALAAELQEVKVAVTKLAEARSIDLSDARKALREIAGEIQEQTLLGQVMVAEKFSTKLADQASTAGAAAVEELTKRLDDLSQKVERRPADQGPVMEGNVVAMPNTATSVYQLGIAEGERRARQRDDPNS